MIIVGITSHQAHPKVPEVEQTMSAAVGMGYLLLALEAAGYGGMWRTGGLAYNPEIAKGLGLGDHETITGFLYTGSVDSRKPRYPGPTPRSLSAAGHSSCWRLPLPVPAGEIPCRFTACRGRLKAPNTAPAHAAQQLLKTGIVIAFTPA